MYNEYTDGYKLCLLQNHTNLFLPYYEDTLLEVFVSTERSSVAVLLWSCVGGLICDILFRH